MKDHQARTLLDLEEALRLVGPHTNRLPAEMVALDRADGRILARSIQADRDQPPFARATMDGFAVRSQDFTDRPGSAATSNAADYFAELELVGTLPAGKNPERSLLPGECLRIMTGAMLPPGADAVIRQEDAEVTGKRVRFRARARPGLCIAPQGEDARAGEELLAAGHRITPAVAALLATTGHIEVPVYRQPRIGIVVTGDEIIPVEATPGPVQIRSSNGYLLQSYLRHSGTSTDFRIVPDDLPALKNAIAAAINMDLLLLCGGVSVGERDLVPAALADSGFETLFHGVNIKPGKPILFARRDGLTVLALPGNPFAVQIGARIFLETILRAMAGRPQEEPLRLPLADGRKKKEHRLEFFPADFGVKQGQTFLRARKHSGSGDIRAGVAAAGVALQRQAVIQPGEAVEFWPELCL